MLLVWAVQSKSRGGWSREGGGGGGGGGEGLMAISRLCAAWLCLACYSFESCVVSCH